MYFVLNSIITIPISKYYEVGKVTRKKLPCDLALQAFKFIANSSDTLNIVWKILSIQFISKNTFGLCNKLYIKLFACQINNQFSYCTKVRNKASATIPTINSAQKTLIAVDAILITLRLSLLRTHTIERIRPSRTKTILAPAQTVRIPFDREKCRSDGARAVSGRMLTMSAAILID